MKRVTRVKSDPVAEPAGSSGEALAPDTKSPAAGPQQEASSPLDVGEAPAQPQSADIFISYSRKDIAFAPAVGQRQGSRSMVGAGRPRNRLTHPA